MKRIISIVLFSFFLINAAHAVPIEYALSNLNRALSNLEVTIKAVQDVRSTSNAVASSASNPDQFQDGLAELSPLLEMVVVYFSNQPDDKILSKIRRLFCDVCRNVYKVVRRASIKKRQLRKQDLRKMQDYLRAFEEKLVCLGCAQNDQDSVCVTNCLHNISRILRDVILDDTAIEYDSLRAFFEDIVDSIVRKPLKVITVSGVLVGVGVAGVYGIPWLTRYIKNYRSGGGMSGPVKNYRVDAKNSTQIVLNDENFIKFFKNRDSIDFVLKYDLIKKLLDDDFSKDECEELSTLFNTFNFLNDEVNENNSVIAQDKFDKIKRVCSERWR